MKRFVAMMASVVLLGLAVAAAQDAAKDEKKSDCGIDVHKIVCSAMSKECTEGCKGCGKDEHECKAECTHAVETVGAALTKLGEEFKASGMKCAECEKRADGKVCEPCIKMVEENVGAWLKTQLHAEHPSHTRTDKDGKETHLECTIKTGPVCTGCVEDIDTMLMAKCKELVEKMNKK